MGIEKDFSCQIPGAEVNENKQPCQPISEQEIRILIDETWEPFARCGYEVTINRTYEDGSVLAQVIMNEEYYTLWVIFYYNEHCNLSFTEIDKPTRITF